ncbi:MAG: 16S rRNA (cytidine(1402)-2'-O)-methyltransferase [Burkholderiales bacterium]|nr:16S rRNA (cytidine(1402)-2'-O)-methyltransferase [Burkholderiales bacterium]
MGKSTLYVVATPIGNARDITLRALDVLAGVDLIAAEDTRNTAHLLRLHGLSAKPGALVALHEHNERQGAERIIDALAAGTSVALVSDAGTPTISDPGGLLVRSVREAGYRVIPVPGANAMLAALSAAGLPAQQFLFYGFLPAKETARRRELEALQSLPYTLVFYEAPHRVLECVADLFGTLGEREITIARELTKLFETIHTGRLSEAVAWLNGDANRQRGEFVLLVAGAAMVAESGEGERVLRALLAELPLKQAVALTARITGEKRNAIYQLALTIKNGA